MASRKKHIEIIARGLILHGQYLLACRNVKGGYHYLPGGHVEFGESTETALLRELKEETGLTLKAGPLLLACETRFGAGSSAHHEVNFVFHVERMSTARTGPPAIRSKEKGIQFDWIDLAAIPEFDFRPTAIRAWIVAGCRPSVDGVDWISDAE